MARICLAVVEAIRKTAKALHESNTYQWGHMGSCNCGFLAQQVTLLKKEDIHAHAMQRHGDWNEQLNDYCPTSGLPMDELISMMIAFGFDASDLKHLEKLSAKEILEALPVQHKHLKHNIKTDVILYFETWARVIEDKLLKKIKIPSWGITEKV